MSIEDAGPVSPVSIDDPQVWERASAVLAQGQCIVVPTDTVYGIAARAGDGQAVARLQDIKGRSDAFPPPVLVADAEDVWTLVGTAPVQAVRLAAAYWPGALTLVLATDRTGLSLAASVGTVGLRVPDHAALRQFLRRTGPLAVSSANKHDQAAATSVEEAVAQLGDEVWLYVDGGPTPGPAPSTVVDCSGPDMRVLRVGRLSEAEIWATAGARDA